MTAVDRLRPGRSGAGSRVVRVGAATFLTLGLGTTLLFGGAGLASSRSTLAASIVVGVLLVLGSLASAGWSWGWLVAAAVGADRRPAAKVGLRAFGGMAFLMAFPIDATQLFLGDAWRWPFGVHGYFTTVFVVGMWVIAGFATTRLARHLGASDPRRIGWLSGAAAGAGMVVGSIVAVAVGFEVDGIRPHMVWAIMVAAPFAALAGGLALAWGLERRPTGSARS